MDPTMSNRQYTLLSTLWMVGSNIGIDPAGPIEFDTDVDRLLKRMTAVVHSVLGACSLLTAFRPRSLFP